MGYDCLGSDINPRMVDYTKANLDWLRKLPKTPLSKEVSIEVLRADATKYRWPRQPSLIASETDLGPPFANPPSGAQLEAARNNCNQIVREFLVNLRQQIESGTRLCLALPAWQITDTKLSYLPLLDSIEVIGYNRVSFRHSRDEQLIYKRPGQIVARELLVLSKI
jgi:tRNA G10  N-methylase Trm11